MKIKIDKDKFKKEKFLGEKACVLGLGKSGRAVARLLAGQGFDVLISEETPMQKKNFSFPACVTVQTGGHSNEIFDCGFWIKSPGIFPNHPALVEARRR